MRRTSIFVIALLFGVFIALLLGELAIRMVHRELFSTSNLISRIFRVNNIKARPVDSSLGWALPLESERVTLNLSSTGLGGKSFRPYVVKIHQGFRSTPNHWRVPLDDSKLVIALGDSFTFGGEVSDEETWPSHLQALSKLRTTNLGVSLYGLDQSVIRLKRILEIFHPKTVILSVIRESILRTQRKKVILSWTGEWVERPYFLKKAGKLELQNVPIQQNSEPMSLTGIRQWLGRSHLADWLLSRIAFNWWYGMNWGKPIPLEYLTGEDPQDISCLLLESFLELSKKHHFQPVVLGQYYWQDPYKTFESEPLTQAVLQCSKNLGIVTIDLEGKLRELAKKSPEEYNTLYFPGAHMTNRGNWWVANEISKALSFGKDG
jgi:hypothetical protein